MTRTPTPQDGLCWITGASSGIGEETALRLAAEGWTVVASARRAALLDELAGKAKGPGRIIAAPLDVTDLAATRALVTRLEAEHGPIARVILNAGTYQPDSARTFSAESFAATHAINVQGVINGVDAVLPKLIERKKGHIVIVSSVAGYRGLPRALAYGSSKAAMINFAESLKLDLDHHGIKVQLVNPGFIKTPLTDKNDFPMPFLMPVAEAVSVLVKEMNESHFEITFPKTFAFMLQRLRCLPYVLYFTLARQVMPK
jgi:NAD(P)-dependent dehydrogenase (short-subunit alcohol dehydrogenase family)